MLIFKSSLWQRQESYSYAHTFLDGFVIDYSFLCITLLLIQTSSLYLRQGEKLRSPSQVKAGSNVTRVFSLPTCVNTRPGWPTIWQVWRMDCRPLAAADSWWAGMTVIVWGTVCTVPLNCFLLASSTSSGVQLTPCFSLWAENHTCDTDRVHLTLIFCFKVYFKTVSL